MEYVFIDHMHGISGKGNPYHMIKLADSATFENHRISYDPNYIHPSAIDFRKGEVVKIEGQLNSPYSSTEFIATSIQRVKELVKS